jgi:hypothetical protein
LNIFCSFYFKIPWQIRRINAATDYIFTPNKEFVNLNEGFSHLTFDRNGYPNANQKLAKEKILLLGSSYMEANQVDEPFRVSTLLNNYFSKNPKEELTVYNISRSGNFFPGIIKGFRAAVDEFPDSKAIVIELNNSLFDLTLLHDALNQVSYDFKETGSMLMKNRNLKLKILTGYADKFPYFELLKSKQFKDLGNNNLDNYELSENNKNEVLVSDKKYYEYFRLINKSMKLFRGQYRNPIILLYHPGVKLLKNGKMKLMEDKKSKGIFAKCAKDNDINWLDVGLAFLQNYEKNHEVPTGFWNTTMASGHWNKVGHKIVSEELLKKLKEVEK